MPKIAILSREQATSAFASDHGYAHVVSISDHGAPPPPGFAALRCRKLALHFYDLADGADEERPQRRHVEAILEFAAPIVVGDRVLVHCNAGISRSSAAALTILASRRRPSADAAAEAVAELLQIKQDIYPNTAMVEYADALLGYGGELVARVEAEFRSRYVILW